MKLERKIKKRTGRKRSREKIKRVKFNMCFTITISHYPLLFPPFIIAMFLTLLFLYEE